MNASKENAQIALNILKQLKESAIMQAEYELDASLCDSLELFLEKAKAKLPSEASYEREASRRRAQAKRSDSPTDQRIG